MISLYFHRQKQLTQNGEVSDWQASCIIVMIRAISILSFWAFHCWRYICRRIIAIWFTEYFDVWSKTEFDHFIANLTTYCCGRMNLMTFNIVGSPKLLFTNYCLANVREQHTYNRSQHTLRLMMSTLSKNAHTYKLFKISAYMYTIGIGRYITVCKNNFSCDGNETVLMWMNLSFRFN